MGIDIQLALAYGFLFEDQQDCAEKIKSIWEWLDEEEQECWFESVWGKERPDSHEKKKEDSSDGKKRKRKSSFGEWSIRDDSHIDGQILLFHPGTIVEGRKRARFPFDNVAGIPLGENFELPVVPKYVERDAARLYKILKRQESPRGFTLDKPQFVLFCWKG
jgi:hypothetical protein